MERIRIASVYTILLGLFLLAEGIWGLSSKIVFQVLTTNTTHAVIHIALGVLGLWMGIIRRPRNYCLLVGLLLLTVGVLRFVPGLDQWTIELLNVNFAVAYLNIGIGIFSILVAAFARPVAIV